MLIEQAAYASRWRQVSPVAKGCLALAGVASAFVATTPMLAASIAAILMLVTCFGAGVPFWHFIRVAAPAIGFLVVSSLSLLVSIGVDSTGNLSWQLTPDAIPHIETVATRSLASLAALLLLVLTTPMPDLIGLLRRLHLPDVLLDLMVLCYRMLFVFSQAVHDTLTAQQARLGYSTTRGSLYSLGSLAANLALQVWQRSRSLHLAAMARNGDGPLRFLAPDFAHARRDTAFAASAGCALIIATARLGA